MEPNKHTILLNHRNTHKSHCKKNTLLRKGSPSSTTVPYRLECKSSGSGKTTTHNEAHLLDCAALPPPHAGQAGVADSVLGQHHPHQPRQRQQQEGKEADDRQHRCSGERHGMGGPGSVLPNAPHTPPCGTGQTNKQAALRKSFTGLWVGSQEPQDCMKYHVATLSFTWTRHEINTHFGPRFFGRRCTWSLTFDGL